MTENCFILQLKQLWPKGEDDATSIAALDLSSQALRAFPNSATLWHMRAMLLELSPADYATKLSPRDCYEQAIRFNAERSDIWEDFGYYLDAAEDNFSDAEEAFRTALSLGGGPESVYGLARVSRKRQ